MIEKFLTLNNLMHVSLFAKFFWVAEFIFGNICVWGILGSGWHRDWDFGNLSFLPNKSRVFFKRRILLKKKIWKPQKKTFCKDLKTQLLCTKNGKEFPTPILRGSERFQSFWIKDDVFISFSIFFSFSF